MKYKDLHYQPASRNLSRSKIWVKTLIGIVGLTIILIGVKLLFSPVMNAIAGFLQDSSTSISYFLSTSGGKIRQDNGITNILLLGVDTRSYGGTTLTDTIIVASYRHSDRQVSLLSLPRDLWVDMPAFGSVSAYSTKVNAVFSTGEEYEYPGGGIALLSTVLSKHLGIPLHYYAKVDFNSFEKVINTINGVDIYVENSFTDYEYPRAGYEDAPWNERWEIITFDQGWQHMDGGTALKYARSRHAYGPEGSDFARARRQQKVILAIKDKVLSSETLFNLPRMRELFLTFNGEVDTNIGLAEIPLLYDAAKKIGDSDRVKNFVLTPDPSLEGGILYVPDAAQFGGAYVLLPQNGWTAVQQFVQEKLYSALPDDSLESPDTSSTPTTHE